MEQNNELEKCKKRVVQKDINFLSKENSQSTKISHPLYRSAERQTRQQGARPDDLYFF